MPTDKSIGEFDGVPMKSILKSRNGVTRRLLFAKYSIIRKFNIIHKSSSYGNHNNSKEGVLLTKKKKKDRQRDIYNYRKNKYIVQFCDDIIYYQLPQLPKDKSDIYYNKIENRRMKKNEITRLKEKEERKRKRTICSMILSFVKYCREYSIRGYRIIQFFSFCK